MGKIKIFVNEGATITYHDVDHVYLVINEGIEFEGRENPLSGIEQWKFPFKTFMWWESDMNVRVHIHKNSILP